MASGGGLAIAAGGALIMWSGLSGVTPLAVVKSMVDDQKLPPIDIGSFFGSLAKGFSIANIGGLLHAVTNASDTTGASFPGGTSFGSNVATKALSYVGVPYVWGGSDPTGWDCSGMVTYILHSDFGINLPSNTHTTSQEFYVWGGLTTVPTAQMQPGDLVCWLTHIAIVTSPGNCVGAENPSSGTVEGPINQMGPGTGETYIIRRLVTQTPTVVNA